MVIPLHLTVHVRVQSRRLFKNYFLLVMEVFDRQFLFDEQTQRRIGGTEGWSG